VTDVPDIFAEAPDALAEAPAAYGAAPAAPAETIPPFFADARHGLRLYQGDALDLLRRARSGMFDLIFADPPYFLSNNGITCQSGQMVSVNKGMWDHAETFEAMHAFNVDWLRECRRLLKPNGAIWVTGTNHNIYSVGFAMQTLEYKILNDIAWHKVNPPPNLACRYFTHAHETILWARRSARGRHVFHYEEMKAENGGKQMQSVWHILPPRKEEKAHGKHPTQKPLALLDRILRASTNPGDLVLDPFCGSGTTAVAAARLGRRFVGFEREAAYLRLAAKRTCDELPQATFFFMLPVGATVDNQRTWAEIVANALHHLGGEAALAELTVAVGSHPRTRSVRTWTCTVRRVVRQSPQFVAVARGRYKLAGGGIT